MRIVRDDDISSGNEELHPDWLELYNRMKRQLRREVPPPAIRRLEEFFASAQPYDPLITEINPSEHSISFLLGAGASKPEPSGIPTVKELLPDLLTRARRLDRDEVTRLASFCDDSGIDNIEDLLTAAQISEFCSRNPYILRLVDFLIFREEAFEDRPPSFSYPRPRRRRIDVSSVAFLQDTLQVLFGLLSSRMLPAEPNAGHEAIVEYLRAHSNTPIVTTNYDCCIDRALMKSNVPFSYLIEFANPQLLPSAAETASTLIKLHGSLNWFYCETCQEVHLIDIEKTVTEYQEDRASYPVIGVCRNCGGQRRGLLVPPLAMKFDVAPPLNPLIDRAAASFAQSNLIVVVGFSFADADLYISRMLSKAMQASEQTRLIVFDPVYDVVEKVRRKFSVRIPQFDASRILWVRGDCSEMLPKFLNGALLKQRESYSEVAANGSPSES
jgi:NAD-dependent SIR2 family protein deacetylase